MNSLKIKKIINNILNNSIDEVREYRKVKSKEWLESEREYYNTYEKVRDILKSQGYDKLALDLESKMLNVEFYIANFYYREGIRDQLTKLRFLEEFDNDMVRYI